MKSIVLSVLIFLFTVSTANAGSNDNWLKLGVVPYKSPRALVELYSPIAVLLTKALGKNVQVVTAGGYDSYLQRIYGKQYDIILLGSTFYFKAHDKAGYEGVARGYPPFRCGLIVRSDSDIHDITQLRGKKLAAVNIMDRGGFKIQKKALFSVGINIEDDLEVHYRGCHDSVVYAVLNGQDDVGAIRLDALQKNDFSDFKDKIRTIYVSPDIPQFPFAVRDDMDPAMREKISKALTSITMGQPETADILRSLNIQGFEQISSAELELLRQARLKEDLTLGMP
jgi:phosphonate transport system substrate-binding protein